MNQENLNKLISESIAIEAEEAKSAGRLGFMARALVQATMPHKNPGDVEGWGRENGLFSMTMQSGILKKGNEIKRIGLPYGSYPRLLLAWLTTEAVRTKNPQLRLGESLSEFMGQLDLSPTGGRWGTIPMLKEQMKRLFSCTVSFQYEDKSKEISSGFRVASKTILFWDTKSPDQAGLWESSVILSDEFFNEIISNSIPIDMGALRALKGSSMRLDIYSWLTYRMSYLSKQTCIPWPILALQFGSEYKLMRQFKAAFLKQLKAVQVIYPACIALAGEHGLILKPSPTHISYSG
jgi:hypothetical protein